MTSVELMPQAMDDLSFRDAQDSGWHLGSEGLAFDTGYLQDATVIMREPSNALGDDGLDARRKGRPLELGGLTPSTLRVQYQVSALL